MTLSGARSGPKKKSTEIESSLATFWRNFLEKSNCLKTSSQSGNNPLDQERDGMESIRASTSSEKGSGGYH